MGKMLLKNNFLFGIVATTICLCGVNGAIALTVLSSAEQRQISIDAAEFSNTRTGETLPICQVGKYVSKCNGYDVGFNWLKSATFPTNLLSYTTKNYYVVSDDVYVTGKPLVAVAAFVISPFFTRTVGFSTSAKSARHSIF